ncbi:MAG TPA: ATP-dependent sacrificial sulfur transferase LarE [Spirochaetota bacterium]|nr:ATP-dependent sacrificial sulfur transferase LarE [Spirochaetota bacterium]
MEDKRIQQLNALLRGYSPIVVAVSGGVDSSFLARVAHQVCGDSMLAVHLVSEFTIPAETRFIREFTARYAIPFHEMNVEVLNIPAIVENNSQRCYHCKKAMFTALSAEAARLGFPTVADGSTPDDDNDYRPGARALRELGIVSPLREAGFSRDMIEEALGHMDIHMPSFCSNSCLATRVPYNTPITAKNLGAIGHAEDFLQQKGFTGVRVRNHHPLARLELNISDAARLFSDDSLRNEIVRELKTAGFSYITVDAEGFQSGSMNRTIQEERNK